MSDHKPNTCYYKPHRLRQRVFTQKDAARIFCQAKADSGATELGFINDCPCWDRSKVDPEGAECIEQRAMLIDLLSFLAGYLALSLVPGGTVVKALSQALKLAGRAIPAIERTRIFRLVHDLPRQNVELNHLLSRAKELLRDQ